MIQNPEVLKPSNRAAHVRFSIIHTVMDIWEPGDISFEKTVRCITTGKVTLPGRLPERGC